MQTNRTEKINRSDITPWRDENTLRHFYLTKEYSLIETAEVLGCAECTVLEWCRKHGIETRKAGGTHNVDTSIPHRNKSTLQELYHEEGLSTLEISGRLGVDKTTVVKWLGKHEIETREGAPTGEDNPSWNGGYELYYGANWNEQNRKARKRDNDTCQVCGHSPGPEDIQLDVHHIIPLAQFDNPENANNLNNLITLCRSCHSRWEGIPLQPQVVD